MFSLRGCFLCNAGDYDIGDGGCGPMNALQHFGGLGQEAGYGGEKNCTMLLSTSCWNDMVMVDAVLDFIKIGKSQQVS